MSNGRVTILDGGMGRELERRGAPFKQPEWSALALMKAPGIVKEVHKDFIRNGAGVISTNSYALVPFHIGEELLQNEGRALAASAYLSWAQQWRRKGASLIGGCCGIGPDHIALLAEKLVV